jgi:hypothetical protein
MVPASAASGSGLALWSGVASGLAPESGVASNLAPESGVGSGFGRESRPRRSETGAPVLTAERAVDVTRDLEAGKSGGRVGHTDPGCQGDFIDEQLPALYCFEHGHLGGVDSRTEKPGRKSETHTGEAFDHILPTPDQRRARSNQFIGAG